MERQNYFSLFQESKKESEKMKKIEEIRKEVGGVRDSLGKPVDRGVMETVIFLKALGLRTDQSCEGHSDHGLPAPWVEVYPEEPSVENWQESEELRNRVLEEEKKLREKTTKLLDEFYKERIVDKKIRLGLRDIGYGFRVQSGWLTEFEREKGKIESGKLETSRREMAAFTRFLKEKFLESEEI